MPSKPYTRPTVVKSKIDILSDIEAIFLNLDYIIRKDSRVSSSESQCENCSFLALFKIFKKHVQMTYQVSKKLLFLH